MPFHQPFVRRGDPFNTETWNAMITALAQVQNISGSPPIEVVNTAMGLQIRYSGPPVIRHAITCKDDKNYPRTYPKRTDNPDTYAIKFTTISYIELAGHQGHITNYLDNRTIFDGYVHNLYDGEDEKYLPEATEVWCYFYDGQWFTWSCCKFTESSSSISVSVSSLSSSSNSSSSRSSNSSSSSKSSASSASLSSNSSSSSASSSSRSSSSSLSSSSASSSSASSASSSSRSSASSLSSASLSSLSSQSVSSSSSSSLSSSSSASSSSSSRSSLSSLSSASSSSLSSASSGSSSSSSSASSGSSSSSASVSLSSLSSSSSASSASSASSGSSSSKSSASSESVTSSSSRSSASSLSSVSVSVSSASSASSQSASSASSASSRSSQSLSSASSQSASSQSLSSASSQSASSQSSTSLSSQSFSSQSSTSLSSNQSSQSCSGPLKPWHRFQLIDKLETDIGSSAEAWVLEWSNATGDWEQTGELVTVHNYNGRHFGLPGEKGWARCEGDSKKPEVIDLGGLVRFGKLEGDLHQGSFVGMEIWNIPSGGSTEGDGGYQITVRDWMLPPGGLIAKNAKVWAQFDCISKRWYAISWAGGPLLGKPSSDISQAPNSGTVAVYTGAKGSEAASGSTVTGYNRMFGKIRSTEWVWLDSQDGGLSWEIIATEGANEIYGKTPAGSTLSATFPGNNVTVNVYKNGVNTGVTIQAMVVHAPIIDGEGVHCVWTGEQYSVVSGDFDGGILATYTGTGSNAILAAGGNSSSFKVAPGPGAAPTTPISFSVSNDEAPVLAGTKLWLGRNVNRFYVVSGQMTSAYGQLHQGSIGSVNDVAVGSNATINVFQSGSDTGATISAAVEHAPIVESEFVTCTWDGLQWIVASGDYDGGIIGKYYGSSDLAKGSSSALFNLQTFPNTTPTPSTNFTISSPLGSVGAGKLVRIGRDATGWFVVSAEC